MMIIFVAVVLSVVTAAPTSRLRRDVIILEDDPLASDTVYDTDYVYIERETVVIVPPPTFLESLVDAAAALIS